MGNRALIVGNKNKSFGVYLHWNGGKNSVEAFLKHCDLRGFRGFDTPYGMARFTQVVANYFGGDLSIGIEPVGVGDEVCIDNGVYVVEGWKEVYHIGEPATEDGYDIDRFLREIDKTQPKSEQLGTDFFDAEIVSFDEITIGDEVFVTGYKGYERQTIVGIGKLGKIVNGTEVGGLPYFWEYGSTLETAADNINNYVRAAEVRRVKK